VVSIIYGLCALTAFLCSWLLMQAYMRSRYRLLLWGSLCFAGLTMNNILVISDKFLFPAVDLSIWRLVTALVAMLILLYGLIWDKE
jgi:hypothetical protein